jgi:hypothetical protein
MRVVARGILAASLVLCAASPGLARADTVDACIQGDADVQRLRADGRLGQALATAKACSSAACPRLVREDCGRFAREIDAAMPTVRVIAIDADGSAPERVRAFIDGAAQADFATGKPLRLDPGKHVLRLEGDGLRPVEQIVDLVEQDDRVVTLHVERAAAAAPAGPAPAAPLTPLGPLPERRPADRREPAAFYVFGAIAAGGLLAFAGLGSAGAVDYEVLRKQCGPSCSPGRVGTDHTLLVGADVGLVVALVAGGVSAFSHFTGSL